MTIIRYVREWNYPFPFPFPNSQMSFLLTPAQQKDENDKADDAKMFDNDEKNDDDNIEEQAIHYLVGNELGVQDLNDLALRREIYFG